MRSYTYGREIKPEETTDFGNCQKDFYGKRI
jgi:hypothetical protein